MAASAERGELRCSRCGVTFPASPGASPSAPWPDRCPACERKADGPEPAASRKAASGPMDTAWVELASKIEEHLREEPPREPRTTMQLTRLGHPLGRMRPKEAPVQNAGKATLLMPTASPRRPPAAPESSAGQGPLLPPPSTGLPPAEVGSAAETALPPGAGATPEARPVGEAPPNGATPSADSAEKLPPAPSSLPLTETPSQLAELMGDQPPIITPVSEEAVPVPEETQEASQPNWFQTALAMQTGGPPPAEGASSSPSLELPIHTGPPEAPPIVAPPLLAPAGFVRSTPLAHRSIARVLIGAALLVLLTGGVLGARWWGQGREGTDRAPPPRVQPAPAVQTADPSPNLAPPPSPPEPAAEGEPAPPPPPAVPAPGAASAVPQWASELVQQAQRLSCARPRKLRPQYTRLLSLPDRAADAHVGLAACALKEKQVSAAIRSLEAALALRQDHPAAVLGLAFATRRSGDLERARAMYRRYLELPDAPEATKAKVRKLSAQLDKVRNPRAALD